MKLIVPGAVLSSLLAFPIPSAGCSLAACASNGVELRPNFVVSVAHGGKPLSGVTVQVTKLGGEENGVIVFSGRTSPDGAVHVINIPVGEYWLDAGLLGITAGRQCFHIGNHTSRKAKRTVKYEWGDLAPSTRQIAGKLIDPQPGEGATLLQNIRNRVVEPIPDARLKLQNAVTGAVYNTLSNRDGDFSFASTPNGTYVLHIDGGTIPSGHAYDSADLLISLSDTAKQNMLLLKRTGGGGGSCGGPTLSLEVRSSPT